MIAVLRCAAIMGSVADNNHTVGTMDEEFPLTTPLQEFLAKLQQTMDRPPNKADPVRGDRERLMGILAFLTKFISRVSTSPRLRKTVNSFLRDQIHHLRQLNEGIQSPLYKAKIRAGSPWRRSAWRGKRSNGADRRRYEGFELAAPPVYGVACLVYRQTN